MASPVRRQIKEHPLIFTQVIIPGSLRSRGKYAISAGRKTNTGIYVIMWRTVSTRYQK